MKQWVVDERSAGFDESIRAASQYIQQGKLVAFPTETVYGLGANALDETAVRRVFAAKHRPADNPLIVHIAEVSQLTPLLPSGYAPSVRERALMEAFWPGPLTMLFPASAAVAPSVHPGSELVGVRMPAHPIASALIRASGCPIAAPSANRSGRPSPTSAADVIEDLAGEIDGLLDGGACGIGVESTVLTVLEDKVIILRPGGITQEMISDVMDIPVVYDAHLMGADKPPLAPGMRYRHYAPDARVHVWWGEAPDIYAAMCTLLLDEDSMYSHPPMRPAVIAPDDFLSRYTFPSGVRLIPFHHEMYADELAQHLYSQLRACDHDGITDILVHGVNPARGIGTAVMNRLQKAAEGRSFRV